MTAIFFSKQNDFFFQTFLINKILYFTYLYMRCTKHIDHPVLSINQSIDWGKHRTLDNDGWHLADPRKTISCQQLPYVLSVEYDAHHGALLPPHVNIPAKGYVPDLVETFTLHLPCTGNISDEVPIAINLLVQGPPKRNDTKLTFKRNKICLKGKSTVIECVPSVCRHRT